MFIFVVGNTYREIRRADAKLDRTGTYRKIHEWCLYLGVIGGNPDSIQSVKFGLHATFSPHSYICQCPIPIQYENPTSIINNDDAGKIGVPRAVWRFQTRQQTSRATGSYSLSRVISMYSTSSNAIGNIIFPDSLLTILSKASLASLSPFCFNFSSYST